MFDLKGHPRGVGSFHFRLTNCDLRSPTPYRVNRKSYIVNFRPLSPSLHFGVPDWRRQQGGRPQGSFKIKKPSQNVKKIGKVMQGKASVFDPPPPGAPSKSSNP